MLFRSACVLMCVDLFLRPERRGIIHMLAMLTLAFAAIITLRADYLSEGGWAVTAFSDSFVRDPMGDRDELYDLHADPWELYNVVDREEHAGVLAEMRLRLADWSMETEDSPPVPLPEDEHYQFE